jgi:hypothetical protein
VVALASSSARAETHVGSSTGRFGESGPRNFRSPQWFMLEVKFGPYVPGIDSSPGLSSTPFATIFGDPERPGEKPPSFLLTTLEFDVQFFKKFGTLAAGFAIGYYRNTAKALQYYPPTSTTPCTPGMCYQSGDDTAINIIPMELLLIYRFDYLLNRWRVPLVPYFKFGIAYYIWVIQDGSGGIAKTVDPDGTEHAGQGGTWGITLHPGLSFALDALDVTAGRVLDAELGINHVHLFIEMNYGEISNFGRDRTLVLSDLTFNAGLGFEF